MLEVTTMQCQYGSLGNGAQQQNDSWWFHDLPQCRANSKTSSNSSTTQLTTFLNTKKHWRPKTWSNVKHWKPAETIKIHLALASQIRGDDTYVSLCTGLLQHLQSNKLRMTFGTCHACTWPLSFEEPLQNNGSYFHRISSAIKQHQMSRNIKYSNSKLASLISLSSWSMSSFLLSLKLLIFVKKLSLFLLFPLI